MVSPGAITIPATALSRHLLASRTNAIAPFLVRAFRRSDALDHQSRRVVAVQARDCFGRGELACLLPLRAVSEHVLLANQSVAVRASCNRGRSFILQRNGKPLRYHFCIAIADLVFVRKAFPRVMSRPMRDTSAERLNFRAEWSVRLLPGQESPFA